MIAQKSSLIPDIIEPSKPVRFSIYLTKRNIQWYKNGQKFTNLAKIQRECDGILLVVVDQTNLSIIASRSYHTQHFELERKDLTATLKSLPDGLIVVLLSVGSGSGVFELDDCSIYSFLYPKLCSILSKSEIPWIFAYISGAEILASVHTNDHSAYASFIIYSSPSRQKPCYYAQSGHSQQKLAAFCQKWILYPEFCKCKEMNYLISNESRLESDWSTPIVIIAKNRPHCLSRLINSIIYSNSISLHHITVYMDGKDAEILEFISLFPLKYQIMNATCERACRISMHYRNSIHDIFITNSNSSEVLILEEDLIISPDFFDLFHQTIDVLRNDPGILCVSSWNDHSYSNASGNPSILYQIDGMPGLGWMLKREIFLNELYPRWPIVNTSGDWDIWIRMRMLNHRKCIIPELSRVYHHGIRGMHVNREFQRRYFSSKPFSNYTSTVFDISMINSTNYPILIRSIVKNSKVFDLCGDTRVCIHDATRKTNDGLDLQIISKLPRNLFVIFLEMKHLGDFIAWKAISRQLHIWDLDLRGFYQLTFRLWIGAKHYIIVLCPYSPFCDLVPSEIHLFNSTTVRLLDSHKPSTGN